MQTCLQFKPLLILTYFDLIQTKELKDRLMIYSAFEILPDLKIKLNRKLFFPFSSTVFRLPGILIEDFQTSRREKVILTKKYCKP